MKPALKSLKVASLGLAKGGAHGACAGSFLAPFRKTGTTTAATGQ